MTCYVCQNVLYSRAYYNILYIPQCNALNLIFHFYEWAWNNYLKYLTCSFTHFMFLCKSEIKMEINLFSPKIIAGCYTCNIMKLCDNNVAYIGLFLWINACFLKQGGVQYTSTVKYTVVISKLWPIVIFIILIVIILLWTSVFFFFFLQTR